MVRRHTKFTTKNRTTLKRLTTKANKLTKGMEVKTHDKTFANAKIAYDTENATDLSSIAQGDSQTTRDGSALLAKSIQIKMKVSTPSTGSDPTGQQFRVMLIKAKQRFVPSSINTADRIVWQNGNTVDAPNSPYHVSFRSHYVVLFDRRYFVNGGVNSGPTGFNVNINKKLNSIIRFQGTTTTHEHGGLYLIMTTDSSAATSAGPEVRYTSRITYTDA